MKNSKDKIIQGQLDNKLKNTDFEVEPGHDEDEKIYRLVYQGLKKEPEYDLPHDFADKVVTKLQPSGLARYLNPDQGLLVIFIPAIVALSFGIFSLFKSKIDLGALSMSSNMVITIIIGIICLILIQVADQKLLKPKIFRALK